MTLDQDLYAVQQMREVIRQAKKAQEQFLSFSQSQVDQIVSAMAEAAYEQANDLAQLAVEETGLGVIHHKTIKNQVAARDVYLSIKDVKTVGIVHEDKEKKMIEVAAPFGVIAGITPVTNPTSTAIFKSIIAVKSRNAIIFSPHPAAASCTIAAARICLNAAVKAGAPDGLIGWISNPTLELTEQLMTSRDVQLILSTGGSGLVRAAYSSGKPAFGVGPGNVPVYLERTCDISHSVKRIVDSKTFDHGTICASEQAIIVDQVIKDMVIREFQQQGAYFLNEEEKRQMEKLISPSPGRLNPEIVGQSAQHIAQMAGISVPKSIRLLIAHETQVGKEIPFSIEKLSPVFAFYTVRGYEEALNLSERLLELGGKGHTLALHTKNEEIAKQFILRIPVSRIVVNTPAAIGAIGGTTGLLPSMTLGCGTFGGNITSDNISVEHLINKKRLAYGLKDIVIPAGNQNSEQENTETLFTAIPQDEQLEQLVNQVLSRLGHQDEVDQRTVAEVVHKVLAQI